MNNNSHHITPPKWPLKLLRFFVKKEYLEEVEGDMEEVFQENLERHSEKKARRLYVRETLRLLKPILIKNMEGTVRLNQFGMLKSYFKVSYRSMARNKLFTAINIIGLAVSMSVGLLIIAFISDLKSFDDFHAKKDRIYRITTIGQRRNGSSMTVATTSVKAGYEIRETIPGVEKITFLRRGFGADAKVGDSKILLSGLYADNSFLDVFSFDLIEGNPASALRDPYSLVLTESTALKLFGKTNVVGESVRFDTLNYTVTGLLRNLPKFTHFQFEALVSFSTVELYKPDTNGGFLDWENFYMNYTYAVLSEGHDLQSFQANLDRLCQEQNVNLNLENKEIMLSPQPLTDISTGGFLPNQIGSSMDPIALLVLIILVVIVIISACFNYTNLSIARAMKRAREVGIRKVVGAERGQIAGQFITESILVSVLALAFSFIIFLALKDQFVNIHPYISKLTSLNLSLEVILYFIGLAITIGVIAGFFPALLFSKIKALQVVKGMSSFQLFKHVNIRKSLIAIQYVFSLLFITTTVLGYKQYKSILTHDLGFKTESIVNISLQGNNANLLKQKLLGLPEVIEISQSQLITSLGSVYGGGNVKYKGDSSSFYQNFVDENYLSLHRYLFLSGENFSYKPHGSEESKVIVNEQVIRELNIGNGDPFQAVGEIVSIDGKNLVIAGVVKDFHYQNLTSKIKPFIMRHSSNPQGYLNVKITTQESEETMVSFQNVWEEIDPTHPLNAMFYDDQIKRSYSHFSMILKVIGFLSFLTICISSLGLLGMVVFATESRLKEISIRKVLGASEGSLIYLLSRSFLLIFTLAAAIALPLTYLLFDKVILINFPYHEPVGITELLVGFLGVLTIAVLMIGSQTFQASRINPTVNLKDE
ncbi:ABC transporter permease [Reichenbachiella sp. MALMAid0571]|uniref:ABC transporter permease n=1 Tax=Reichenbachiella sp. MALMAid0571 TaxID=3143939 RepID=UPI0032DFA3BB